MTRLTSKQMRDALEKAKRERLERESRGEPTPLDKWGDQHPDGLPPDASPEEIKQLEEALRASGLGT